MYIFSGGTVALICVLLIVLFAVRYISHQAIGISLDNLLSVALMLRLLWAIVVIMLEDMGMIYFVFDDESYHLVAMGEMKVENLNGYYAFLRGVYNVFGQSSLNGRLVSLFFSLYTIYPVAIIEYNLTDNESMLATKFTALSPFMVFVSFFEMKDIILMFLYVSIYAVINQYQRHQSVGRFILILMMAVLAEGLRHGAGVLPVGIFVLSYCIQGIGNTKMQRLLTALFGICIGAGSVLYVGAEYITELALSLDRYQRWILTQFSEYSIYNKFVISSIKDIWKLPFCFLLYVMQPLNVLDGSKRFFAEFGMIVKIVDVPILLIAVMFLPKYIKREKWASMILLIPFAFLSGVNLTNAREGLYLYPLLYIVFAAGLDNMEPEKCKNAIARIYNDTVLWKNAWTSATLLWLILVLYQMISGMG